MAADDVSADAEMMLFAIAHNDEMFAPMSRRTHHQRSGIMREAHIICPTGQTSLKKARFRVLFLAGAEGLEPSRTVLETAMLPLHHAPISATGVL